MFKVVNKLIIKLFSNRRYLQNFPIWSIVSFLQTNYTLENEFILSVDGNGSVRKWSTISNTDIIGKLYIGNFKRMYLYSYVYNKKPIR